MRIHIHVCGSAQAEELRKTISHVADQETPRLMFHKSPADSWLPDPDPAPSSADFISLL